MAKTKTSFKTGHKRSLKAGRKKGSLNKFTNLKNAFLEAFEKSGGTQGLVDWAGQEKNKKDFYLMVARMLPNKKEVLNYIGKSLAKS